MSCAAPASASINTRTSNIAARVSGQVLAALARGVKPWVQPFSSLPPPIPRRSTGEPYKGSNVPMLWAAAAAGGYLSPFWFTFKQAAALNAHIRRGERGSLVVFYAPRGSREGEDTTPSEGAAPDTSARTAVLRAYTVFNADQIEGLPPGLNPTTVPVATVASSGCAAIAAAFARVPARIVFANRAFYRPSTDTVHIPPLDAFHSPTHYYSTLAHELAHWTRHPDRLNRDFPSTRFGDTGYALEELTAELTAAFVGADLGLPVDHIEDHSAYIASWLKTLTHDPSAFLTAAGHAQRAADYLNTFLSAHASAAT